MSRKFSKGDRVSLRKAFSIEEVEHFACLSLDSNPLHLDEDYASQSAFGGRIVHGMLAASLFSGLLGQELPGPGTIYLGQELRFLRPIYINEEITATIEAVKIREDKPIATFRTICQNKDGDTLIEGTAIVRYL